MAIDVSSKTNSPAQIIFAGCQKSSWTRLSQRADRCPSKHRTRHLKACRPHVFPHAEMRARAIIGRARLAISPVATSLMPRRSVCSLFLLSTGRARFRLSLYDFFARYRNFFEGRGQKLRIRKRWMKHTEVSKRIVCITISRRRISQKSEAQNFCLPTFVTRRLIEEEERKNICFCVSTFQRQHFVDRGCCSWLVNHYLRRHLRFLCEREIVLCNIFLHSSGIFDLQYWKHALFVERWRTAFETSSWFPLEVIACRSQKSLSSENDKATTTTKRIKRMKQLLHHHRWITCLE